MTFPSILHYSILPCWLGHACVVFSAKGIASVLLGDAAQDDMLRSAQERHKGIQLAHLPSSSPHNARLAIIQDAIETPHHASNLPLDIAGTPFQRNVWNALCAIPVGQTRTYSQIATTIGRPTATRAVARACADNMHAVLIPCHRVIGKNRKLTGYRWGIERKRALLEREGISP